MTPLEASDAVIDCPLCGQQFRRVTGNGSVSYFQTDVENDSGARCPFGDQARTLNPDAKSVSASRPQSSPGGCLKDLVVTIHELHQLERRAYDGAMLAACHCALGNGASAAQTHRRRFRIRVRRSSQFRPASHGSCSTGTLQSISVQHAAIPVGILPVVAAVCVQTALLRAFPAEASRSNPELGKMAFAE